MYTLGQKVWFTPTGMFAVEAVIDDVAFHNKERWFYAKDMDSWENFMFRHGVEGGGQFFYHLDEPFYCSIGENDGLIWPTLAAALNSLKVEKSLPGRLRKKLLKYYRGVYITPNHRKTDSPEIKKMREGYRKEMKEMLDKLPNKKVYIRRR